jgi:hypothetical protein|nr:MAG TPA: Protein of unknown function (DUF3277) [Caudoviricetes sp.]DAO80750.1 MAG TPA: Protein of unknown function (DUF3277) [Caudoviricetes sp.]
MAKVSTYNPRKVTCALGRHIVSGFADDSFISIESAGDGTSYVVGADGEVARSIDPSTVYTLKLSLLQTSATNEFLQQMYDRDKSDGGGIFSVSINDIVGEERFVGASAWVTKPATWSRGKAQGNREWEIVVAEGEFK